MLAVLVVVVEVPRDRSLDFSLSSGSFSGSSLPRLGPPRSRGGGKPVKWATVQV